MFLRTIDSLGAYPPSSDQNGAPSGAMLDSFGRHVTYLRVSVTDRCDFRCTYCMAENMTFLPRQELLTAEELDRICSAFITKGVRKLRLSGGEPLVRKNVMSLFRSLSRHLKSGALDELTLTTNGSQLANFAEQLADCGVERINVSLDTLDPEKFRQITRWGDLEKVLAGIEAAQKVGLKIKLNTVGPEGFQLSGDRRYSDLRPWTRDGSDADRNHADGRHQGRSHGPISAAVGTSQIAGAPIYIGRHCVQNGRTRALRHGEGNGRPARFYHAHDP